VTIILTAAADNVSLTTAGATAIDVTASWIDQGPGSPVAPILPSGQNTPIAAVGTFVIAPGPMAANTVRNLKTLTIVNKDPATSNAISVTRTLKGITATMTPGLGGLFILRPGYVLEWADEENWILLDQDGGLVSTCKSPIGISAAGSSVSIGTIVFSNSNNVSFGMNGSTVTATVSLATSPASINVSAGTTSNDLSAITFSNSNGISFGLNGSVLTGSIAVEISNINISAGTTSNNLSAVTFSNSNNVSFGLQGSTLTASATFASTQGSLNLSAGTTSNFASAFTFENANGISFGLNASTITASIATSLSAINVSAGTTSNNLSAVTFANANNVSFGLNGSVVTASAVAQTVTAFSQDADFVTGFVAGQGSLSLQKLSLAMNLQATQLALIADFNGRSGSSGAVTISHAVYTLSGATARLASSASRAISWTSGSATSASAQYGGVSGTRYRTLGVSYAMTPGDYLFAWWIQTTGAVTCTAFGRAGLNLVGTFDGVETNYFLNGVSTSSVGAFPSSIVATDTGYVRTGFSALRQPGVILIGTH
jgi:hypothetical protein